MKKLLHRAFKRLTSSGEEVIDPTPVALPVNYRRPPTLQEQIRYLMRQEDFRRVLEATDTETFEEAEDFEIGEDYDPASPWEEQFEGQFDREARMESQHYEQYGKERRVKTKKDSKAAFLEEKPLKRASDSKLSEAERSE